MGALLVPRSAHPLHAVSRTWRHYLSKGFPTKSEARRSRPQICGKDGRVKDAFVKVPPRSGFRALLALVVGEQQMRKCPTCPRQSWAWRRRNYPGLFINIKSCSGIMPLFPIMRQDAAATLFVNNPGYSLVMRAGASSTPAFGEGKLTNCRSGRYTGALKPERPS